MQKKIMFLVIPVLMSACEREPVPELPVVYPGEYRGRVLFDVCGNITVHFTDGTQRGQMGWRYGVDSTLYNNVFRVANPCTWGWDRNNHDITFSFAAPAPQQCAQCLAWASTPDTAYHIVVRR